MHIGVLEMASLDGLPRTAAYKKDYGYGTSRAGGIPPADVSSRALYSVIAVLGVFLIVSVVGAAVTFVETQAKERNMTSPAVEIIVFVNGSHHQESLLRKDHELKDGNATAFVNVLDFIMMARTTGATASAKYDDVSRKH